MSLYQKIQQLAEKNKPILVGMIGIGKFGSMYLAQVPNTPGVEVLDVTNLFLAGKIQSVTGRLGGGKAFG